MVIYPLQETTIFKGMWTYRNVAKAKDHDSLTEENIQKIKDQRLADQGSKIKDQRSGWWQSGWAYLSGLRATKRVGGMKSRRDLLHSQQGICRHCG